jgi:hypothetical protein
MSGGNGAIQAGTMLPGRLIDIIALGGATSIAVGTTNVAYSESFLLPRGITFGWEVKFTSSGVVAVTVELEQSNQPPTTEKAQDDSFVIPVGKATSNGLFPSGIVIAAATRYLVAYSPVATAFGRLKFTGTGANDASTVCTIARLYAIKTI